MNEPLALVLSYHSISEGPGPLRVAPDRFEQQLDFLRKAGYEPATFRQVVRHVEGKPLPGRRFALTFDDGYRDFTETALPILEGRGLAATLFVTGSEGAPDHGGRTLWGGLGEPLIELAELRALAQRGVVIGAHGRRHEDLTRLSDVELDRELRGSRDLLEERTGGEVEHLSYPFGRFDRRVRAAAARHYRSAATTQLATLSAARDPHAIPRIDAHYLRSPLLRHLLGTGNPTPYLRVRRWLRRVRGREPLRAV